jgi:hypothetical protein
VSRPHTTGVIDVTAIDWASRPAEDMAPAQVRGLPA